MSISDFECVPNSSVVSWVNAGVAVVKQYPSRVFAEELRSHEGVLVVESSHGDPNNAIIYNADGSPRVRLVNPCVAKGAVAFGDVYYVGSELTVVAYGQGDMWACVFDEDGHLQRTYETR